MLDLINQGFDHSSFHQAPTGVGFVVDGSPRLEQDLGHTWIASLRCIVQRR